MSAAFLSLIFVVAEYVAQPSVGLLVLASGLGIAVVGGKAAALPALITFIGVVSLSSLRREIRWWSLLLAGSMAIVTVGSFLYFFAGASVGGESQGSSSVNIGDVVYSDGPIALGIRSPFSTAIGSFALVTLILSSVLGLFVRGPRSTHSQEVVFRGAVLAAIVSLGTGFVYVGDRSGVMYFFQLALVLLLPISIVKFGEHDFGAFFNAKSITLVGGSAAVVAVVWSNLYFEVSATDLSSSLFRSFLMLLPLLGGSAIALAARRTMKSRMPSLRVVAAASTALIMGLAFFAWVPRYARVHVVQGKALVEDRNLVVGSPLYREAFQWIRYNSEVEAIVATNRYCNEIDQLLSDCAASLSMVAAQTDRRMWAENLDFVGGARDKVLDRARDTLVFIDSPSAQSLLPLSSANVSWVFVDKELTKQTNWEPWARVEFENDESFVLRVDASKKKGS
jgi:hypothetical protein